MIHKSVCVYIYIQYIYIYIYIYINTPTVLSLHYNEIVHVWGFVGANRPVRHDPTGQRPTLAASEGAERGRASPPFSLGTGPPALAQTPGGHGSQHSPKTSSHGKEDSPKSSVIKSRSHGIFPDPAKGRTTSRMALLPLHLSHLQS